MTLYRKINFHLPLLLLSALLIVGCRGDDTEEQQVSEFPSTPDVNQFASFLNPAPGVPKDAPSPDELHNQLDFPEAYYNTIDPAKTRTTFDDWREANGFPRKDGTGGNCVAPGCVSTHVKFRDTKDLGYGRNMFLRWDKTSGDVAVYVENFQVIGVPGLPYGPLNLDALVENDRSWNFGVNAIEFSSFPYTGADAVKFAKFYNFAGDGKLALLASGEQQHFVDLDNRGVKPMPTPCIVCHGGRGRTLVYEDAAGTKKVAPTITGGLAGDVLANMQMLEFDTLQFSNAPGFTREENEAGIRLINEAILSTYKQRDLDGQRRRGDWDPALAIDILEGRYANDFADGSYRSDFVPTGWNTDPETRNVYATLIGPNCMVCHALRGSDLSSSIAFKDVSTFLTYGERIDHLVFERGLMPAGLLNYADFWESGLKNPAELARRIGHSERIDANGNAIAPGDPIVVIAAPLIATGLNSTTSATFDIQLSSGGSAFLAEGSQQWSVEPASDATITATNAGKDAVLRASSAGLYTVTLRATGSEKAKATEAQWTISVVDEAANTTPPPPEQITFYGADDRSIRGILNTACVGCHVQGPPLEGVLPIEDQPRFEGIAIHFQPCNSTDTNGYDFLYRSVLARVNFSDPLSSLMVRKPTNGATDLMNRSETVTPSYHGGVLALDSDAEISKLISWILNGAPRGDLPVDPIPATAAACL